MEDGALPAHLQDDDFRPHGGEPAEIGHVVFDRLPVGDLPELGELVLTRGDDRHLFEDLLRFYRKSSDL